MDEETRTITLAYFEKQSTVDYIGVAQGIPIAFDAKETAGKSLPLQNIHAHQMAFMSLSALRKSRQNRHRFPVPLPVYFLLPFFSA